MNALREKIQKLADGIFEYDSPKMAVSTTSIMEAVEECAYFSGSFFVESLSGEDIEGTVLASHVRMWCKEPHFKGKKCEITYEADLRGLSYGEEVKGSFTLLTNGGEITVPCTISIEKCYMDGPSGKIKNLFHFANFAREDWDGAIKFFESDDFKHLLINNDRQYREVYQGLRYGKNMSQAMDEFLVVVRKKERVKLNLPEKKKSLKNIRERERFTFSLEKNTWGYVSAKISVRGGFLELEKEHVTQEDFLGNTCEMECYVNHEKLHGGLNTGCIQVEMDSEKLVCEIQVDMRKNLPEWEIEEQLLKGKLALFDSYLDFRKKACTAVQFSEKGTAQLDELERLDSENLLFKLFRIQFLLIGKKEQEAEWHLNLFEDGRELKEKDETFYGYFLYLRACLKKDEKLSKKVKETISDLYEKHKESFLLLWIRLYLEEELRERREEKWRLLKEQFEGGCKSPLLYLEAWELLREEETLLKALDGFTIQVLNFAIKRELFTESFSERVLSLSLRGTPFSQAIFKIYIKIYEINPSKERLSSVVKLLIREQKTGGCYTSWYFLGVQENLKIAGLFENYMESVDWKSKEELPQALLLYYAMDSSLSVQKKAWIYEQITRRRAEMPIYKQHKKEIEVFRKQQQVKGVIDSSLAILYQAYLEEQLGLAPEKREEDLADLEDVIFWCRIVSKRKNLAKVLVVHQYLERVEEYPYREEGACVPIYTEEDRILLISKDSRCYGKEEDYELQPLFEKEKFYDLFSKKSLGMQIRIELRGERYRRITIENAETIQSLLKVKDLQNEVRQEIMEKLLVYYKGRGMHKELEELLTKLRLEEFSDMARSRILEFMLAEGLYEQAWPVLQEYGFSGINGGKLVGILGFRIRETSFEWESPLLKMCSQVFLLGKYNEDMLVYLMHHAETGSKELWKIWYAASGFGEDTVRLGERLVRQALFTGIELSGLEDVTAELIENGGNPTLVRAYLAREAYKSLLEEKILSTPLFSQIEQFLKAKKKLPIVCKAAWLKGIAEGKSEKIERKLLFDCVKSCRREGLVFPFFQDLEGKSGESLGLEQLEVISHRAVPGSRVVLHSILETGENRDEGYLLEPMQEVLPGIYIKQLTLFSGEKLLYYITEENGAEPNLLAQQEIVGRAPRRTGGSRKNLLGRIMEADCGPSADESRLLSLLDEYISLDYMTEQLFQKK